MEPLELELYFDEHVSLYYGGHRKCIVRVAHIVLLIPADCLGIMPIHGGLCQKEE